MSGIMTLASKDEATKSRDWKETKVCPSAALSDMVKYTYTVFLTPMLSLSATSPPALLKPVHCFCNRRKKVVTKAAVVTKTMHGSSNSSGGGSSSPHD